jgi:hypothetical protein
MQRGFEYFLKTPGLFRRMITGVNINLIRFFFPQLALREKLEEKVISAMSIENNDFLKAVSSDFIKNALHQFHKQVRSDGQSSRKTAGFINLSEIKRRKNNSRFDFGGFCCKDMAIQIIGSERQKIAGTSVQRARDTLATVKRLNAPSTERECDAYTLGESGRGRYDFRTDSIR